VPTTAAPATGSGRLHLLASPARLADTRSRFSGADAGQHREARESIGDAPATGQRDALRLIRHALALDEAPRFDAVDAHGAARRPLVAEDQREDRALAGTGGTGDARDFARRDSDGYVVEGSRRASERRRVRFRDVTELDHRTGACAPGTCGASVGSGWQLVQAPGPARCMKLLASWTRPIRISTHPR